MLVSRIAARIIVVEGWVVWAKKKGEGGRRRKEQTKGTAHFRRERDVEQKGRSIRKPAWPKSPR